MLFPRAQLMKGQHGLWQWLEGEEATGRYLNQRRPSLLTHMCATRPRPQSLGLDELNTFIQGVEPIFQPIEINENSAGKRLGIRFSAVIGYQDIEAWWCIYSSVKMIIIGADNCLELVLCQAITRIIKDGSIEMLLESKYWLKCRLQNIYSFAQDWLY